MRRGVVLGTLLAVLVGIGFYFLGLAPVFESIEDLETQTEAAVQDEGRLLQERNRLRRIQESELQYIDAVGEIARMIPPTPQQSDLLNDLEALANDANVVWKGASFSPPAAGPEGSSLRQITVTMQLEGQYFEILAYLYSVQDLERILRVDSAAFSPVQDEDGLTQLSTSLALVAFTTGDVGLPAPDSEEEGS